MNLCLPRSHSQLSVKKELRVSKDEKDGKQQSHTETTSPAIVQNNHHQQLGAEQQEAKQQQQEQTERDVKTVESGAESTVEKVTMKRHPLTLRPIQRRFSVPETIMRR